MASSPHTDNDSDIHNCNTTTTLPTIHDVLIIGAGPSGLAVAARLRETTPSALYTDEEHRRYHWLRKHSGKSSVKNRRTGRVKLAKSSQDDSSSDSSSSSSSSSSQQAPQHKRDLLVLDAEGPAWLTRWHALFAAFRISHLRSPMFFHPDPSDRDSLLAFAHAEERTGELLEIGGCVGKEVSKHKIKKEKRRRMLRGGKKEAGCEECDARAAGKEGVKQGMAMAPVTVDERDRKDYFTPSSAMFGDFVQSLVERYGLAEQGLVKEEEVQDVEFGVVPMLSGGGGTERLFTVRVAGGGVHYAKSVVLAVGAGNAPCIPAPFEGVGMGHEAACHALSLRGDCGLPKVLKDKVRAGKRTNVLVIGGGLTSAQIGDLVLKQGVTKVWHLTRGALKVKPFDIDLNWMSKFRNQEKAAFWMADDDYERAEMLKAARGGGSLTPRFAKILQSHIQTNRTALHTNTTVQTQLYNPTSQTWTLTTSPPIPDLPEIDHVYFATGVQSDISTLPFMRKMLPDYPLQVRDGLPTLTDDLAWRDDVPLFCAGKFAGLRLGPGAANLEGARAGAERIVLAVEKVLGDDGEGEGGGGGGGGEVAGGEGKARRDSGFEGEDGERGEGEVSPEARYRSGLGSRYEALMMDE